MSKEVVLKNFKAKCIKKKGNKEKCVIIRTKVPKTKTKTKTVTRNKNSIPDIREQRKRYFTLLDAIDKRKAKAKGDAISGNELTKLLRELIDKLKKPPTQTPSKPKTNTTSTQATEQPPETRTTSTQATEPVEEKSIDPEKFNASQLAAEKYYNDVIQSQRKFNRESIEKARKKEESIRQRQLRENIQEQLRVNKAAEKARKAEKAKKADEQKQKEADAKKKAKEIASVLKTETAAKKAEKEAEKAEAKAKAEAPQSKPILDLMKEQQQKPEALKKKKEKDKLDKQLKDKEQAITDLGNKINEEDDQEKKDALRTDMLALSSEHGDILTEMDNLGLRLSQGRGKTDDGLFDYQIDELLTGTPYYQGVISADEIPLIKPAKKISFVMNTDVSSGKGKHWVAVYIDAEDDYEINYYDSLGDPPSDMFMRDIKKLADKVSPIYQLRMKINSIRSQKDDSTTCGYMAVAFIRKRLRMSFKDATGFKEPTDDNTKKGEAEAEKIKDKFDNI